MCASCGTREGRITQNKRKRSDGSYYVRKLCAGCKHDLYQKQKKKKDTFLINLIPAYKVPEGYLELAKETELRIARKYGKRIT